MKKSIHLFQKVMYISLKGNCHAVPIYILRDTGATHSLLVGVLPLSEETATGTQALIQGLELGIVSVLLHTICLKSDLVSRSVVVGLYPTLTIEGVPLILGNGLAGEKVIPELQVVTEQEAMKEVDHDAGTTLNIFPSCAVTGAMVREINNKNPEDSVVNLDDTFMSHSHGSNIKESSKGVELSEDPESSIVISDRDRLIEEQRKDPELARLVQRAVDND